MKKIYKNKILNIKHTDIFDNTFLFEYFVTQSTLPKTQITLPQPLSKRGERDFQNLTQVNHRIPYNRDLRDRRKKLKQNLTFYEKKVWQEVCKPLQEKYDIRILQQRVIGNFIVDFYIASLDLVVEIDGESHFDEQGGAYDKQGGAYDKERTHILEGYGLKVLRFTNNEVKDNTKEVFLALEKVIQEKNSPLLERGWGRDIQVIYLGELLEKHKNTEIEKRLGEKPAMYSEVYSPKDELQIFTKLLENALKNKQKIHIVGVTLGEEIQILEEYYRELGFMREDINAFDVDFSIPLVTVSCHIENLMWRGSDYKAQREKIFFNPPIRESGQNKAIFKGITRGVIAGIDFSHSFPLLERDGGGVLPDEYIEFIGDCVREEKILPIHMGKVLKYNLEDVGFECEVGELKVMY